MWDIPSTILPLPLPLPLLVLVLKIEIWKVQVQLVQFENHFNEAREASK
jgi:hypothetical protein